MFVHGFHSGAPGGNLTGITKDYWKLLGDAGKPATQKGADGYGPCYEVVELIRTTGVQHVVAFRLSTRGQKDGYDYDVPQYHLAPTDAARIHWQATLAKLPPEFRDDPFHKEHVWLEVINEVDHERSDWLGEFGVAIGELALSDGYKVALFGFSSGEPEPEDWDTPGMSAYLRMCAQYPDRIAVSLHEYSYHDDIWHEYPYHVGRFQALFASCDRRGIPRPKVLITEWGWHYTQVPSPGVALAQIEEVANLYDIYKDVIMASIWYLGPGFAGIAEKTQQLIRPVGVLGLRFVSQPGDTGVPQQPKTLKHTGHILPQDTVLAELQAVTKYLHPTRSLFTYSHDAIEALMYHSTPEGVINAWDAERWDFDLEAQFSWLGVNFVRRHFSEVMDEPPGEFRYKSWPVYLVEPYVTQHWGARPDFYKKFGLPGHDGVDIRAPEGSLLLSPFDDARVYRVHTHGVDPYHNYGTHVRIINDKANEVFIFAHMSETRVEVGQVLQAGEPVGLSGNTGNSSGAHLHAGRKRPGETYTDVHGTWGYNLHDPSLYLKELESDLFPDTPPPPPPPGVLYDMKDFMTVDEQYGVLYELQTEGAGQERVQTQTDGQVFYHTKNRLWEQLMWNGSHILRFTDTSFSLAEFYQLRDNPDLPWSEWMLRYMAVGQVFNRTPEVSVYRKSDCNILSVAYDPSYIKLEAVHDNYDFFTGISLRNVIQLAWHGANGNFVERYYYAIGFGLVGWEKFDGTRSAISEIHAPGARPNNFREVIGCLPIT